MGSRCLLVLLLAACSRPVQAPATPAPAASAAAAPQRHAALREEARSLLERHCGECHVGSRPTARPGALAVFDLMEPDWSARMSAEQLASVERRIAGKQPTDVERAHLHEYAALERAQASPAP